MSHTWSRTVWSLVFSFLLAPILCAQEESVAAAREVYNAVNANLGKYKVGETEISLKGEEPVQVKVWRDGEAIRRVVAGFAGDHGATTREFYYDDGGALVFVFEVIETEEMQTGKVVAKVEHRYYFGGGKLVRWLDSDKEPVASEEPEFADREKMLLAMSEGFLAGLGTGGERGKASAETTGGKLLGRGQTDGTFLGIEEGDYFHLQLRDSAGEEQSFFVLRPDESVEPFLESPEKLKGKKMRVFWEERMEDLPEAGGKLRLKTVTRIERLQ